MAYGDASCNYIIVVNGILASTICRYGWLPLSKLSTHLAEGKGPSVLNMIKLRVITTKPCFYIHLFNTESHLYLIFALRYSSLRAASNKSDRSHCDIKFKKKCSSTTLLSTALKICLIASTVEKKVLTSIAHGASRSFWQFLPYPPRN